MKFILKANCEFEADSIDDSFVKLGKHFDSMAKDGLTNANDLFDGGEIEIKPAEEDA